MLAYALRRIVGLVPTLFVLVSLSFFIIRLAPGGPFDQEQSLPPQVRANLDAAYGLDQPLAVQYGRYLAGLARGDLGPSLRYRDFRVDGTDRERSAAVSNYRPGGRGAGIPARRTARRLGRLAPAIRARPAP